MNPEPIMIPCEGSGHQVNGHSCAMCGEPVTVVSGLAAQHDRKDILAMIDRGDFG